MHQRNYSTLFTVVMLLVSATFIPAIVEGQFADERELSDLASIPTTYAASPEHQPSLVTSTGYVGSYGLNPVSDPVAPPTPQVLGITAEQVNAPPPYRAQEVDRSNAVLNLNPGQAVTVWVDFLNTGAATWHSGSSHFVALNLTNPTGRTSVFQHQFWQTGYRPARLMQNEVRPGETGRFRFALQAPLEPGQYQEDFSLVAEGVTWIDGGFTSFRIGVGEAAVRPPDFEAAIVEQSGGGIIEVEPGTAFTFWVDFKNTGLQNWYNSGDHFIAINVTDPAARVSPFKHDYWNEYYYRPGRLQQARVYPGETGRFRFALQVPNVEEYYSETFQLVAENLTWIEGGKFTLRFKVGTPPTPSPLNHTITDEPTVRIGLFKTVDGVTVTSGEAYTVTNGNTAARSKKSAGEPTTLGYATDAYWRITPDTADGIIEISNYTNLPSWNSALNDNTYRGTIEVRYSESANEMWVINELPVESYLRGLAEVSNEQPPEYLKALVTAARSYVLWHQTMGGKHPDIYFDINATTDQVYRGYGFEQRSIDPLAAVAATAGEIITHPDAVSEINPHGIAVAAYSSGTDGRTRDWNEVWAGSGFPWLVSVADPYGILDNWDTLSGNHMVGLSAKGARGYATEEGKSYGWILQHFYAGVSIEKIY